MPPKKSAAAAPAKEKKPAAGKRAREAADAPAEPVAAPLPPPVADNVHPNKGLIRGLEHLAACEYHHGDKFAAVAFLQAAQAMRVAVPARIEASKEIPRNEQQHAISRAVRALIDEMLASPKGETVRLTELMAGDKKIPDGFDLSDPKTIALVEEGGAVPEKPVDDKTMKAIEDQKVKLWELKLDGLKTMLRTNRQHTSGVKPDLVSRIAQGKVMGALPTCPKCFGGKLKFKPEAGIYFCHGYQDDDTYIPCFYRANHAVCDPWVE